MKEIIVKQSLLPAYQLSAAALCGSNIKPATAQPILSLNVDHVLWSGPCMWSSSCKCVSHYLLWRYWPIQGNSDAAECQTLISLPDNNLGQTRMTVYTMLSCVITCIYFNGYARTGILWLQSTLVVNMKDNTKNVLKDNFKKLVK